MFFYILDKISNNQDINISTVYSDFDIASDSVWDKPERIRRKRNVFLDFVDESRYFDERGFRYLVDAGRRNYLHRDYDGDERPYPKEKTAGNAGHAQRAQARL